jgi:hypothetical protein
LYKSPNEFIPPKKIMAIIIVAVRIVKDTNTKGDNENFIILVKNAR